MKRSFKIAAVFAITIVYCLAIGVVSHSSVPVILQAKPTTEQSAFITSASVNLFNYLNQKENRVNGHVQFQVKNFKEPYSELSFNSRIISHLFKREIKEYFEISAHLLIQKKISILIFPFNYFW